MTPAAARVKLASHVDPQPAGDGNIVPIPFALCSVSVQNVIGMPYVEFSSAHACAAFCAAASPRKPASTAPMP